MKIRAYVAASAAALTLAGATAAGASTIAFTTPLLYEFGDCTPACTPQFQQVYSASKFSGPVTITGITFIYRNGDASQTYVFTLSTSANPVGSLSATFADNIGADAQQFYSGPLVSPNASFEAFFAGTPFYYDPADGDLLLDISHPLSLGGTDSTYIGAYSPALQDVSRVYSAQATGPGYTEDQNVGLMTFFTIAGGVPEPSAWAMLIAGFGLVGGLQRRQRMAVSA
jgi:hypothetical protein